MKRQGLRPRTRGFLKETKWDGVVSLECHGADDNIRKSVKFLRALT